MGGLITSPVVWTRTLHVLAALWAAAWRLTAVYTVPGVIVAGLLGFYQVTAAGIGFRAGWVKASSVLYLILLAIVLLAQAPALRKAAQGGGPLSPAIAMLAHVDALLVVILVLLMAFKPF